MRSKLLIILALVTAIAAIGVYAAKGNTHYVAALTGDKEVPSVDTKAKGTAKFVLNADGTEIRYTVKESGIDNPTAGHIHSGAPGTNGPVVVSLYPVSGQSRNGNILARGTITSSSLVGSLQGKTVADLVDLINSGNAYVNIHSTAHPDGEIRGWIKLKTGK